MKEIRDEVEHLILRRTDLKWAPLFQACCLNFEEFLVKQFGEKLSLQRELSFALQFAKMDVDQITSLQKFDIPEEIEALDARLQKHMSEEDRAVTRSSQTVTAKPLAWLKRRGARLL
jgi:hypothetical protein